MSKRPLAALCAMLAFMAVLVAVPLATAEPAEAHDVYYWKTVRTCIVDPPINHCTTERVRVPAHHKHLPATCPAGTTGTPPNCVADKPTTTTDAPPPTTPPKQCPAGSHRYGNGCHSHGFTPPSCGTGTWIPHAGHSITFLQPCPTTTTTDAPPPTTTTAPPPGCATDHHRHSAGGTCHRDHVPPCGVGTWDPGHGHARVDRPACAYSDASHAMGPITYCGTQSHTHKTRHSHYGGNGCHAVADVHPAPPDPTRYADANACANWAEDLVAAINTNSSPLPDRPADCKSMTTAEIAGVTRVVIARFGSAIGGALKKVIEYQGEAADGEREAYAELGEEIQKLWDKTPAEAKAFIEGFAKSAGCSALILVIAKTTVATAGAAAPAWLKALSTPGGAVVGGAICGGAIEAAQEAVKNWGKDDGSDDAGSDQGGDDDDSSEQDADPEPEADPKPTAAEIKQNDDELSEAARRYRDEEITLAEYQAAFRRWMRWRCEEMGQTKWCHR